MSSQGIIGPFFFEDNNGKCQSVNVAILRRSKACLRQRRQNITSQLLMQDGAPPHTAKNSLDWISANFQQRVVSLKTNFEWAPYSPDLNPLDFFLWGHLKDVVYRETPATIEDLKDCISNHIRQIDADKDLCARVIRNFQKRIHLCLERGGRHIEHIL